jgi:hypothetical protein
LRSETRSFIQASGDRVVVGEQPLEVGCFLSLWPCHVDVGIMYAGVLGEEERFELDERFDVILARDLHTRYRPHHSDGVEVALERFLFSSYAAPHPGRSGTRHKDVRR